MNAPATTPAEAEALAIDAVASYVAKCRFTGREHMGNCLMKLASVTALVMANAEGCERAAQRLIGTGEFIRENGPVDPVPMETVQ